MEIIDLTLGAKLAGNKPDVARELLGILRRCLPNELQNIQQAKKNENFPELLSHVHKLYGATCYCGVPRLKKSLAVLEFAIRKKKQLEEIITSYQDAEKEALLVIEELEKMNA